ncbi:MAG: hypothetical protein A2381_19285 [Bdellovibrionales bacterium RIFOXYB1_FULL_37_110]|nr:MAG: hypothetical protein A2181_00140 [Bdellovibrionales bacterium RIFOXYA1_FULL_38_20]OFZ49522.1 MAG: hypothetical protein A2417_04435 [Bdellovibrionales bacterium RIFOXYC1_FULL_37_79]OFZ58676.1 MAG: hypothetical protein A2381_19285 [Bdellovibrionales bacterium RIFOXYB1_FULL_37_110]OFZ63206.1 MAG: hypothetical protein A2577_16800 [Bdellovibrionales bacterium RIFOXYD1_FULL_36_51]
MKNKRGFTLVEIVVAMGIFGLITLAVAQISISTTSTFWRNIESQVARSNLHLAINKMETLFVNIAPIQRQNSPIESLDEGELNYFGVGGLTSNTATESSQCLYTAKVEGEDEVFSIMRLSSISPKKKSLKTMVPWPDTLGTPTDLIVNAINSSAYLFASVITDTPDPTREILIIDSEGLATKRLEVHKVKYIETTVDPYSGSIDDPPVTYKYYQVSVKQPKTFTGKYNQKIDLSFMSNSTIYPVNTQILCVDQNFHLILKDEYTGASKILYHSPKSGFQISKFNIQYANVSTPLSNTPPLYYPFPTGNTLEDQKKRRCINSIKIHAVLQNNSQNKGNPINLEKSIFLYNFYNKQSADCTL